MNGNARNTVTNKTKTVNHIQIFISKCDNKNAYVWDCGGHGTWKNNANPIKSSFWAYSGAKAIRISK